MEILMPLFAVIAVIAGAYLTVKWAAKRRNAFSSGNYIRIIERVVLGKDAYLVIAKVGEKSYMLSMTSQRVDMLCELDPDSLKPVKNEPRDTDFLSLMTAAFGRKTGNLANRKNEERDGTEE
jgi:flagellar biogenesis protein FliO